MNIVNCPNCGKSDYTVYYSTSTALYWSTRVVDGQVIDNNPNIRTTHCTCNICHHNFYYKEQYGEIIDIEDVGSAQKEEEEIEVINENLSITAQNDSANTATVPINMNYILAPSSEMKNQIDILTKDDLKKVEQKVDTALIKIKDLALKLDKIARGLN